MSSDSATTRERILEATLQLLKSRGASIRMEDVARDAGVSRQTVYIQFANRSALFMQAARHLDAQEGLLDRIRPYRTATSGREALRLWLEFWPEYITVVYPLASALLQLAETDEAARDAWNDRMQAVLEGCQIVAGKLAAEGILDDAFDAERAAQFLYGTVSICSWETFTRFCGWSQEEFVERMRLVLERTLLKRG